VIKQTETPGLGDRAIAALPPAIVNKQSADVDVLSGATVTSRAIINAVKDALSKAK
jgi:fumarate reductase flavoprotein subunit